MQPGGAVSTDVVLATSEQQRDSPLHRSRPDCNDGDKDLKECFNKGFNFSSIIIITELEKFET